MARKGHTLTEAEHRDRRRADRKRLEAAIAELMTSDGWRRWLRTRAVLHEYSWRNTLLIASQCRVRGLEATRVAGFRAWLKLGRCVRKGETGLRIWAPMTVKVAAEDDDGQSVERRRTIFRVARVFDVSQTDPLPDVDPAALAPPSGGEVEGDSHAHLIPALERVAGEIGYRVAWQPTLGGARGLCHRRERDPLIEVVSTLAPNAKVAVLVHELCHALIGPDAALPYSVEEVVVEAAAYVACSSAGLATDIDSVPYIAGWAKDGDPIDLLQGVATRVDALASRIEAAIAAPREPAETEPGTDRHPRARAA
jgi:antirestriction protein ArdC